MYDGTGDPDDHIAQYKQRMLAVALPRESREATMCKGFGSTLIGPALQWYINLTSRSISSFAVLSDKFVEQFTSRRDLEKTSDNLYDILQHRSEPFCAYIASFNQKKRTPEFSNELPSSKQTSEFSNELPSSQRNFRVLQRTSEFSNELPSSLRDPSSQLTSEFLMNFRVLEPSGS
ncbi:hypothetical protein Bca4012_083998 [Brassica carinata]